MHLFLGVAAYILTFGARCGVSSPITDANQVFENLRDTGRFFINIFIINLARLSFGDNQTFSQYISLINFRWHH